MTRKQTCWKMRPSDFLKTFALLHLSVRGLSGALCPLTRVGKVVFYCCPKGLKAKTPSLWGMSYINICWNGIEISRFLISYKTSHYLLIHISKVPFFSLTRFYEEKWFRASLLFRKNNNFTATGECCPVPNKTRRPIMMTNDFKMGFQTLERMSTFSVLVLFVILRPSTILVAMMMIMMFEWQKLKMTFLGTISKKKRKCHSLSRKVGEAMVTPRTSIVIGCYSNFFPSSLWCGA